MPAQPARKLVTPTSTRQARQVVYTDQSNAQHVPTEVHINTTLTHHAW